MTIIVNWLTPTAVDGRRTPIEANFINGENLLVWARVGADPAVWPVIHTAGEVAPRFIEHSRVSVGGGPIFGGSFSLLPLGGWRDSPVEVFAESTSGATDATFSPAGGVAFDRFASLEIALTGGLASDARPARIIVRSGEAPWHWHLAYYGMDDVFAPLFAPSARNGAAISLLPTGGWWSSTLSVDVLTTT